ncbi:acetate/propionate family kinase [Lactobacillus kefiranofaciens]|uniref:Acetate kinase n=1 Tax=Lactobacillus kefiranofaciens TaxID=267818 RepID=A0AAX3UD12_9LACO|nr:acetate kinase [Lactobacillus kefiranofaciens]AEG41093.1 Acetate kinase [Lactobacillus kefiranofaciens subsp. kefiranofaciens]KRM21322.1 acetate kinase [Lactobacillus kefiranofaciens subsp. kefiranofaciens DSM 5016 = JCM 6985]MCJ2172263.1 acetate kinase [Lactobacillus kefiranofaciens]MCP9330575.1 acetate kinase [Lactobacillus kefiranofaciens]MDF4142686.1 acetate kinase [Lactobacillus kefiranofaciens]
MKKVLAINSGSSSFKYKLFSFPDEKVIASGMADRVGLDNAVFKIKLSNGKEYIKNTSIPDQAAAVKLLMEDLQKFNVVKDLKEIAGVGHRVVNGGEIFKDSAIIDDQKLQQIFDLGELAPLHNIPEAMGIKAFKETIPNVPQVAVFDTSYHTSLDPVHYLYSIPYKYYKDYGIRKYGAHGISIDYVAPRAARMMGKNPNIVRLIVCHLGSGASITAVKHGKSFDTSMGFSPLTGVTMGTRSGDFDPSAVQRLMKKTGMSIDEVVDMLNHDSGLLGISGVSSDMRDLIESKKKSAKLARRIFINRVVRYVGAYAAEMDGVDGIVFTAGVGEHDPGIRAGIMASLRFLGLDPDFKANRTDGEKFISKPRSKVKALIVPTNEELMIAREVIRLTR